MFSRENQLLKQILQNHLWSKGPQTLDLWTFGFLDFWTFGLLDSSLDTSSTVQGKGINSWNSKFKNGILYESHSFWTFEIFNEY